MKAIRTKKNSVSIYLNFFLGILSIIFVLLNYSNQKDIEKAEIELNSARDSLSMYQGNYNKLKVQYKILEEVNKEK
jgi:hypothetical protein